MEFGTTTDVRVLPNEQTIVKAIDTESSNTDVIPVPSIVESTTEIKPLD